ncbi:MAG: sugar ABC transporter permease [Litoreibacter sp.]|nr:sugar ABC transporter permease [Litoreibacter sp.]
MNTRFLPYWLLAPSVIFLCIFFLYPFVAVAVQSFSKDGAWTLEHYDDMVGHWKFGSTFWTTVLLAAAIVPFQLLMALSMAKLVSGLTTGRDTILYIFAIPLGISDLAVGIIWLAIFEQSGFLNSMMMSLGIIDQPIILLGHQNKWVIFIAILLAELWRATAIMMVIIVAGMGLIPKEYDEAGEVFGANAWQRFCRISLPLLRPSLQTALILRVIAAFEVFAVVLVLAGSNVTVLMSEVQRWAFDLREPGVAAAIAMIILVISIAATLVIMRVLRVPKEAQI